MGARTGVVEFGVPSRGLRAAPIVAETYWGYVIRPSEPYLERAALIEMSAAFSGVVIFVAAYAQWLVPGISFSPEALAFRAAATVGFALVGAAMILWARAGLVQEIYVDTRKGEVRLVQRNRQGEGRLNDLFPFAEITSIVLKRPVSDVMPSRLCLRLRDRRELDVLPSAEDGLLPLRDRMIRDMSPSFREFSGRITPKPAVRQGAAGSARHSVTPADDAGAAVAT